MNKTFMLERLINHYTNGNKAKFAAMIGISPQTLSKWLSRNTFDAEILYSSCENVSARWLLSGGGEMHENYSMDNSQIGDVRIGDIQFDNNELIDLCKSLVANYQQRDEVMSRLVKMVGK